MQEPRCAWGLGIRVEVMLYLTPEVGTGVFSAQDKVQCHLL